MTTNATNSVTIGSPISDTATLSGATSNRRWHDHLQGLSVRTTLTAAVTAASRPHTVNVNGNYNSGNFTPTEAGTYRWTTNYRGDDNNQAASSPCNAPNESSVVNKAAATIETAQELFPQDSATLSANAGGPVTGSVTFKLYATSDCSGTPVFEQTRPLVNEAANTNNTEFSVDVANDGDYKWLVEYSGDDTHDGATSACGKEAFTATIDDTSN